MAWIELVRVIPALYRTVVDEIQADKDQTMVTSDDASSERKLTMHQAGDDAIHVQKDWVVSRA